MANIRLNSENLKKYHTAKETMDKMKRQSVKWKRMFANHISDPLSDN